MLDVICRVVAHPIEIVKVDNKKFLLGGQLWKAVAELLPHGCKEIAKVHGVGKP